MRLERDAIHVWLADAADFDGNQLEQICLPWLSAPDARRYRRLQFARHRQQLLLGRYMVRTLLSRYAAVAPADWRFTENAYGKPALDPRHHAEELYFNLSHSHGKLALALATTANVGVDIETSNRPRRIARIAERYFSPQEVQALLALPGTQQQTRFYQLWTLKEATIKACGLGLAMPLQQFSFRLGGDGVIGVQFDATLAEKPAHWHFWQFDTGGPQQLALAVQREGDLAPVRISTAPFKGADHEATPEPGMLPIIGATRHV